MVREDEAEGSGSDAGTGKATVAACVSAGTVGSGAFRWCCRTGNNETAGTHVACKQRAAAWADADSGRGWWEWQVSVWDGSDPDIDICGGAMEADPELPHVPERRATPQRASHDAEMQEISSRSATSGAAKMA